MASAVKGILELKTPELSFTRRVSTNTVTVYESLGSIGDKLLKFWSCKSEIANTNVSKSH